MKLAPALTQAAAGCLVLVLVGCGSSEDQAASEAPESTPTSSAPAEGSGAAEKSGGGKPKKEAPSEEAPATPATIDIEALAFEPSEIVVQAGATVEVVNGDGEPPHTVTADDGSFDVSVEASGGTASFEAPTEPGEYPFICTIHPQMTGVLVVE